MTAPPCPSAQHLFVYGTLRRGSASPMHAVLARHAKFVSAGYLQGRLYAVCDYPGAIRDTDPAARVHGELYHLPDGADLLRQLDDYEECAARFPQPHEYVRTTATITLPDGRRLGAWVYLYNLDVSRLTEIPGGDWFHSAGPGAPTITAGRA